MRFVEIIISWTCGRSERLQWIWCHPPITIMHRHAQTVLMAEPAVMLCIGSMQKLKIKFHAKPSLIHQPHVYLLWSERFCSYTRRIKRWFGALWHDWWTSSRKPCQFQSMQSTLLNASTKSAICMFLFDIIDNILIIMRIYRRFTRIFQGYVSNADTIWINSSHGFITIGQYNRFSWTAVGVSVWMSDYIPQKL